MKILARTPRPSARPPPADVLSILLPCRGQKPEFLQSALDSVLSQTSPRWELLVIVAPGFPHSLREIALRSGDERIRLLEHPGCFAAALNAGLRAARSRFASLLLSDDRYASNAVATLLAAIERHPAVDFFHSGARYIDASGRRAAKSRAPVARFELDYFKTWGSPVKHLLCFRREKALEIGGLDETLSDHGCDDFDFPWRMAEAGARFRAVEEPLYEYRRHSASSRLTTDVPLTRQVEALRAMFAKHGVSERETRAYLQRALPGYLVEENDYREERPHARHAVCCFFESTRERTSAGPEPSRPFFPHRVLQLNRAARDALRPARTLCGIEDPQALWQLVLCPAGRAFQLLPDAVDGPEPRDPRGEWGGIASANLALGAGRAHGLTYRAPTEGAHTGERRGLGPGPEQRFEGWEHWLLNALLQFAVDREIPLLFSPTAELAQVQLDATRRDDRVRIESFYDRAVNDFFDARREDGWWRIDVARNRDRLMRLDAGYETTRLPKTISLCHDTERGMGHRDVDPAFSSRADARARPAWIEMAAVERACDVRATYSVVGCLLDEVHAELGRDAHAWAFHSFNHRLPPPSRWRRLERLPLVGERLARRLRKRERAALTRVVEAGEYEQLRLCRAVDGGIKGYRPPQSIIGPGLSDANLALFDFEWLATSSYSLGGLILPCMENGIAKIPILMDDYDLYARGTPYPEWEAAVLRAIEEHEFIAIGLHDCYAEHWLPHYERFLRKLRELGRIVTLDEVAAETALASSRWV